MSRLIESTSVATNPYAPSGAQDVRLYTFNGCENLTLGQLVNAVCCKVGTALENQSVNKTNVMLRHTRRLQGMSEILAGIIDGNGYDTYMTLDGYTSTTYRTFLTDICGLTISTADSTDEDADGVLPKDVSTPAGKIAFYSAIHTKIESVTVTNQQDMVDLQSAISRRDVAYTTATNVVRALGTAVQLTASNY